MTEVLVCSEKLCVRDEERPENRTRPHPTCVLARFVRLRKEGYTVEEARKRAEEECLALGLYHGVSKLSEEARKLGYR